MNSAVTGVDAGSSRRMMRDEFSPGARRLFAFLAVTSILMAPADVGLAFYIGGFNVRVGHFFIILCLPVFLAGYRAAGSIRTPLAGGWLVGWLALNAIFIVNSGNYIRGILFQIWLMLSFLQMLYVVNLFVSTKEVFNLFVWYIRGFTIHAIVGITQFILYFGAKIDLTVESGRVNGFSHEPSAFAGLEIMGYVMLREMRLRRFHFMSLFEIDVSTILILCGLALSTSKTAILAVGLYEGIYAVRTLSLLLFYGRLSFFRGVHLLGIVMVVASAIVLFSFLEKSPLIHTLAQGSGLFGTASHSVRDRLRDLNDTLHVAYDNAIIGVSYGGIATYVYGLRVQTYGLEDVEGETGMGGFFMPAEIVGATGILGMFLLLVYFAKIIRASFVAESPNRELALIMLYAFGFGLVTLVSNFARGAIWSHLAVLSVVLLNGSNNQASARSMARGSIVKVG